MKKIRIIIIILQIFIALGAFGGAYGFISDPTGQSMGMTTTILKDTPFRDFFIPGIILLLVNGVGSTLGALLFLFKQFTAPFFAILLGLALITWIIVQMNMVEFFWLQPAYLVLGILECFLGYILFKDQKKNRFLGD